MHISSGRLANAALTLSTATTGIVKQATDSLHSYADAAKIPQPVSYVNLQKNICSNGVSPISWYMLLVIPRLAHYAQLYYHHSMRVDTLILHF
jgi:hypothetical protein